MAFNKLFNEQLQQEWKFSGKSLEELMVEDLRLGEKGEVLSSLICVTAKLVEVIYFSVFFFTGIHEHLATVRKHPGLCS